ncbi:MAG: BrnT family toxin [Verrucomicrobiae bacterium]|nr:BrnT family toxin [Verrucomicrobiae bacterium]
MNAKKHGNDFVEAQLLWDDPESIGFPAKSDEEERHTLIAKHKSKHRVAFYTLRETQI